MQLHWFTSAQLNVLDMDSCNSAVRFWHVWKVWVCFCGLQLYLFLNYVFLLWYFIFSNIHQRKWCCMCLCTCIITYSVQHHRPAFFISSWMTFFTVRCTTFGSHLILQVVLSVHLMIRDVEIVVGVVVLKHTAGARRQKNQSHHIKYYWLFISGDLLFIYLFWHPKYWLRNKDMKSEHTTHWSRTVPRGEGGEERREVEGERSSPPGRGGGDLCSSPASPCSGSWCPSV